MKYLRLFITPAIIILSAACEKDLKNIKLPEFNQKLVIVAFLCPSDTVTNIYVTSNRKLYGELDQYESRGDLKAIISNGTEETDLDTCSTGLVLDHDKMKIEYGKTYTIKVTSSLGLKAEASCTVPEKKDFSLAIDTTGKYPYYREKIVKVSFKDLPDDKNYYRLQILRIEGSRASELLPVEEQFISDARIDGNIITRHASAWTGFVAVRLYHTEESYYKYHKTLSIYHGGANPFAESTPVFSNITGGLGIFTSYTADLFIIRIK